MKTLARSLAGGILLLALGCDTPQMVGPQIVTTNPPPTQPQVPEQSVVTFIARSDPSPARRDSTFFRYIPEPICGADDGSFARDGTGIKTLHWQHSTGVKSSGMSACYTFKNEGQYLIWGEAEDAKGRTGNPKALMVTIDLSKLKTDTTFITKVVRDTVFLVDTIQGEIRVDTVIQTVTVTLPGRVDTLTWQRPIARARLIGPDVREVGDLVCVEDAGSSSPHGLAIVRRDWVRNDDSKMSGPNTCFEAKYVGDLIFHYQVVDEKGNASLSTSVYLTIKPKSAPPPPSECVSSPSDVTFTFKHEGEFAQVDAKNTGNCSHRVVVEIHREAPDFGVGEQVSRDEATLGPRSSVALKARPDSCEYWLLVILDGIVVKKERLRSHLCTSS